MNSYINGFMVRKDETGRVWIDTAMNVDPCGNVPAWMINILMPRLWKQFYARFFEVYNEYVASTTSRNLESRSFVRKLQKKEQVCPKKIKKIYLYDILDNVTEGPFYDCYTDSTSR
ncbi:hypothetical protein RF11_05888 [Thelohanellus kitauei]|nr:hypothetical protein RF11_05888 [Thelohanellus kitauei]